jgi:hypothetical protein
MWRRKAVGNEGKSVGNEGKFNTHLGVVELKVEVVKVDLNGSSGPRVQVGAGGSRINYIVQVSVDRQIQAHPIWNFVVIKNETRG